MDSDVLFQLIVWLLGLTVPSFLLQSPSAEADLETSLYLVGEIDELTKKMMDTVGGELVKYKKQKDFGSSVWWDGPVEKEKKEWGMLFTKEKTERIFDDDSDNISKFSIGTYVVGTS